MRRSTTSPSAPSRSSPSGASSPEPIAEHPAGCKLYCGLLLEPVEPVFEDEEVGLDVVVELLGGGAVGAVLVPAVPLARLIRSPR